PTVWTTGNLKDAVAGVPTTASWSFIESYLNFILFAPLVSLGYAVPPGMQMVRRFAGRAYLDLTALQAVYFDALGASAAETSHALGGPRFELQLPAPPAALRRRWRRTGLRLIGATLRQLRAYPRAIQQVRLAARAYRRIDWSRLSDAELIESAEQ